jgi:hypothetical protein
MTDLPIWECRYRIHVLKKFISYLDVYSKHSEFSGRRRNGPSFPSDEEGNYARRTINWLTPKVSRYMSESGTYPIIHYREPSAVGGRVLPNIDVMQNIFNLSELDLSLSMVVDDAEKTIGYYEDDVVKSLFRTINPFWWLWKLAVFIVRIPFGIINLAGGNSEQLETSSGGKRYKSISSLAVFIVELVAFLSGIVQILDSFGMIQTVKDFFKTR